MEERKIIDVSIGWYGTVKLEEDGGYLDMEEKDQEGTGIFNKNLLSMPAPAMKPLEACLGKSFCKDDLKSHEWPKNGLEKILFRKIIQESYKARKTHSNPGVDMEPEYFSDSVKEELIKLKEVYEKEIAECKKVEDYNLGWMMGSMGNTVDAYRKRCEVGLKLMRLDNKLQDRERMIS